MTGDTQSTIQVILVTQSGAMSITGIQMRFKINLSFKFSPIPNRGLRYHAGKLWPLHAEQTARAGFWRTHIRKAFMPRDCANSYTAVVFLRVVGGSALPTRMPKLFAPCIKYGCPSSCAANPHKPFHLASKSLTWSTKDLTYHPGELSESNKTAIAQAAYELHPVATTHSQKQYCWMRLSVNASYRQNALKSYPPSLPPVHALRGWNRCKFLLSSSSSCLFAPNPPPFLPRHTPILVQTPCCTWWSHVNVLGRIRRCLSTSPLSYVCRCKRSTCCSVAGLAFSVFGWGTSGA
jgi:hypothetical protein